MIHTLLQPISMVSLRYPGANPTWVPDTYPTATSSHGLLGRLPTVPTLGRPNLRPSQLPQLPRSPNQNDPDVPPQKLSG